MIKLSLKTIAMAVAALFGSLFMGGAALADPGGYFIITNNAKVKVDLTYESYTQAYSRNFQPNIPAKTVSSANWAYAAPGTLSFIGSTVWQDASRQNGCQFITLVSYSSYTGRYSFTFTATKQGGAKNKAVCTITAARNSSTGEFTAYPVIGGF
jgi:hypothetical protein